MGQRGEKRLEVVAADHLDGASELQVEPAAPGYGDLVVEGLAKQCMGEVIVAGFAQGFDHTGLQGLVDCRAADVFIDIVRQRGQQPELEGAADDRCSGEHLVRAGGQAIQAAPDDFLDAFGNAQRTACAGCRTFLCEQARHFTDEQGVAFGLHVNRIDQRRGKGRTAGQMHHVRRFGMGQPTQA
jgi:hypothetical protein